MKEPEILFYAPVSDANQNLEHHLSRQGFRMLRPPQEADILNFFTSTRPDLVIIDSPGHDHAPDLENVGRLRQQCRRTPIIFLVEQSSEDKAVAALRAGVNDYLKQPLSPQDLLERLKQLLPGPSSEAASNEAPPASKEMGPTFIGQSPGIKKIKDYIKRAAALDCNVLITGETGTGKEIVAELIHWHSSRRTKPMIAINCAALPETLLEGELFGYERGSYTGASTSYPGKLGLAEGGTVFLDEIFEMSPYMQAKILRAIETRKIYRLGGRTAIPLNVRIIAATNQDPEQSMAEGTLRPDLFYRLNIARIHLPPLSERPDDIPLLLHHFLQEMNHRYGRRVEGFTDEVLELLVGYAWPGNIRELRNLVEALFVNLPAGLVSVVHLPESFKLLQANLDSPQDEKEQLLEALQSTEWNKSQAAQKLKWSRMTLYRKMQKYNFTEAPQKRQAP